MPFLSALYGSKRRTLALLTCGFSIFLFVLLRETTTTSPILNPFFRSQNGIPELDQGKFWSLFWHDLRAHAPNITPFDHPSNHKLDFSFNASQPRSRPDLIKLSHEQLEGLSKAHSSFVEKLRHKEYSLPYVPRSRGIVTTAGGALIPAALVSILMLRQTGSKLPVEIFLSDRDEWDPEICDKILPGLNAKCLLFQDVFGAAGKEITLNRFQYKIVSILASSFEEVLFMDSDCFPVQNPDQLFDLEPFQSTGLVLWPDFWYASESPLFFQIAGIPAPPLDEKASTESGVLLYSKKSHELPLLLAAYYNYYGPDFYYSLHCQGNFGEGDKETFFWSAVVMDKPYYAVRAHVRALGYITKSGDWRGSGMAQSDVIQDYKMSPEEQLVAYEDDSKMPRPLFVHANYPKIDPAQIFDAESFTRPGPTIDSDGTMRRIWRSNEMDTISFFGYDLEWRLWDIVKNVACKYEKTFVSWQDKKDICLKAERYWNAVFGETSTP